MKFLANAKDGWGGTLIGLGVLALLAFSMWLKPADVGFGELLMALAALGLIGAPPLSKIGVPPKE